MEDKVTQDILRDKLCGYLKDVINTHVKKKESFYNNIGENLGTNCIELLDALKILILNIPVDPNKSTSPTIEQALNTIKDILNAYGDSTGNDPQQKSTIFVWYCDLLITYSNLSKKDLVGTVHSKSDKIKIKIHIEEIRESIMKSTKISANEDTITEDEASLANKTYVEHNSGMGKSSIKQLMYSKQTDYSERDINKLAYLSYYCCSEYAFQSDSSSDDLDLRSEYALFLIEKSPQKRLKLFKQFKSRCTSSKYKAQKTETQLGQDIRKWHRFLLTSAKKYAPDKVEKCIACAASKTFEFCKHCQGTISEYEYIDITGYYLLQEQVINESSAHLFSPEVIK